MRIYASGAININNALTCNSLNVQTGAIASDGSSMWLYNNTNGYGANFALYQGSGGNTVLNSSSGQDMEFKINNTMYMQMYSNGVVQIGSNQVFNKQLVLYDSYAAETPSSATSFYGFGVNSSVLRYQVNSNSASHKFYGGTTNYATINNSGITVNNGGLTSSSITSPSSYSLNLNAPTGYSINFNINNTTYALLSSNIFQATNLSVSNNFNLIPPGTIIMNMSSTIILGYFLCDGSSYSTSVYSNLFGVISYNFGGSGSSFNVPDLRGAFLRGCGTNGSNTSYVGSSIGTAQADTIASHSHTISPPNSNYQYGNNSGSYGNTTGTKSVETSGNYSSFPTSTNSTGSTETRPFNYSVYYFIKW
jgi:microcystin-dependent protein